MNYIIKKEYPGSPKEGTELYLMKPIVGFPYYTDENKIFRIKKEHVENHPEYYVNVEVVRALDEHFSLVPEMNYNR